MGRVAPVMIGADRFEERVNNIMVGRSAETGMFQKQFDRVLQSRMGLTIVSGRPGIGKSFFVEHAAGMVTGGRAVYVQGKFKQYDQSALIAWAEVIEQTVRHILTLPVEALKTIQKDCNATLGADARLILAICPYAQILLATHKPVRTDNLEQLKYRVRKAVCQFLMVAAKALFPLIVFLDDLQWADPLSLSIVETLCQDYDCLNLHLVLAWREEDTGRVFLNPAKLPDDGDIRMELNGLKPEDIDHYVRLVFEQELEHKDYFIRMLYGLTLGNPFNISRVLRLFLQEHILDWSAVHQKWLVRHDKMEMLNLPADIEQLLSGQIDRLEEEERALLHLMACCGRAAASWLKALTGEEENILNRRLERLCKKALLVKTGSNGMAGYGFAHDIVLKLAYSHLGPAEKSKLHYHIAETLTALKNTGTTAGSEPDLAAQLLRADLSWFKGPKRVQWAGEFYEAGVRARQGVALEQALELFKRCAGLLSGSGEEKSGFDLSVRLELSECLFICGQTEEGKQGFESLLVNYPEPEHQIRIKRKYINLCSFDGDFEKVMALGLQILDHFSFKLDLNHFIPDLIKAKLLFSDKKIEQIKSAPVMADQRLLGIMETLTLMLPAANRRNGRMSFMISVKLAVISARHGNSDYVPVAYASYSYVLFHILRDYQKSREFENITLALIERCENAAANYVALCILGSLTHHRTHPLTDTAGCLEQAVEEGEKEGTSLYTSYAITYAIATKYVMGVPLSELKQYIKACRQRQEGLLPHYLASDIYGIYETHIRRLEARAYSEDKGWSDEYRYKTMYTDTIELNGDMLCLQRLYWEGQREKAYRLAEDIEQNVSLSKGFVLNSEIFFYIILSRLAMHQDLSGAKKRHNKRRIKKYLSELKSWVSLYPGNHRARYLLAQAEYNALFAPKKATEKLYREGMDLAEKQGNLPLEALANRLAAQYHQDDPKLAHFYAAEAARLYQRWGASHLATLPWEPNLSLKEAPFQIGNRGRSDEAAGTAETSAVQTGFDVQLLSAAEPEQDILYHLSATEKLTEDEGYLYLLELLARREEADYCAIFFAKDNEMCLKYEKKKGSDACVHRNLLSISHLGSLPQRMIRYVARTETELFSHPKTTDPIFANSLYRKEIDSPAFLCLPIKYSGVLIGIVYMEKASQAEFQDSSPAFIKGFLSSLLARQTTIGQTDIRGILNPQSENTLLTERELEVLKALARGLSNSEISGELHITLGTVRNYLSVIYGKLEVDNRVKAVMKAKALKIIPAQAN